MRGHSIIAILLLFFVTFSVHASAISVEISPNVTEYAPSLVIGEVKRVDSRLESDLITSCATVFVIEVRNGSENLRGKEITVKYVGGEAQNVVLWQSDQPYFHVGEMVEIHLQQRGSLFTVADGVDGKISLDAKLQPITAEVAAGYKLYWYKPGVGVDEATARPGPDWYGPLKWDDIDIPVRYWIDPRNLPTGIADSSFIEYTRRSYQTWQYDLGSYIELAYMETGTDRDWGVDDGFNIFCWRNIDGNGGTLGVTRSYFSYIPGNYDSLRLADSDIELDVGDSWSATETPDKIDLQSVGTHEAGHLVGLADLYDPGDSQMTMFGYTAMGDTRQRTLESGDQAGLHVLYPSSITNKPPTAYIDSILPNPSTQGQTVSFSGHGTDQDGSIVVYEWRSSIDGVLSSSASFSTSSLSIGTHTIYFRVQDNSNAWSTEDTRITTINPAASVFDFSLNNSGGITLTQGGSGSNTITANLISGTSQVVTLSTSSLPSGALASFNPSSGNPTFTSTLTVTTSFSTPPGSYSLVVTGSGNGKTHTTEFTVNVNPSGAGAITVYSLPLSHIGQDPELVKSNDLKASIRVDYVSGGQSTSETSSTYFSVVADVGSTITFTVATTPAGWSFGNRWDWYGHMQYDGTTLTLQVTSESNKIVAFFNSVNQVPTAYVDSISPSPATQGELILFSGHGNDPDGSIAAYEWRSSIDGELSTSTLFSATSLSVGTHTIYFRVQDNAGTWSAEDSRMLTVNPSQSSSTFRVYSLPTSHLGQDPESVRSSDLGATIKVDYVFQGQAKTLTNSTYFDVTTDLGSNITFTVLSAPSGWSFQNKWDHYGHGQFNNMILTLTVFSASNEIAAYLASTSPQVLVSIQTSASTANIQKGGQVSVTVSTTPATKDLEVAIEVSEDNTQWTPWDTGKTENDGKFTTTLSFTNQGVYYVRARWNEGTTSSITISAVSTPCIIATVAYGGYAAPEVVYMRYVRDDLVGSSRIGKVLVEGWNGFYYSWSPAVAAQAARSDSLRLVLRIALSPMVKIVRITAYAFRILAPFSPDLASLFAFALATSMSIGIYVAAPLMAVALTATGLKRKSKVNMTSIQSIILTRRRCVSSPSPLEGKEFRRKGSFGQ